MAITNIKKITIKNCKIDEMHVRKNTANVDLSSNRNPWQIDTYLLAKFENNLEAGNVTNTGVPIDKFAIKRRGVSELSSITLGYIDFNQSGNIEYTDYTQANLEYVYSIVPVGINGLEGQPNEVNVESEFTGWFLVDKDTSNVLAFDKFIDSEPNVEMQLNQGRTQIQTFSQFPSVFYSEENWHSFTLSAVIIPSEFERVGQNYEEILNNFIYNHKPFLVKGSSGQLYVCDCSQPRLSTPLNTWKERDFGVLILNFVEVDSYLNYMQG